jgi:uncharacterized protein DUF5916/cellulose/xylan binding protein with CBM9 domain
MTHRPCLALAALALAPCAARAGAPGDPIVAVRRSGPIVVDGRVDEPAWAAAPVHDGFFQQFPREGEPPSERTEVRVLYDDQALYVGVVALDSQPAEVSRPLGRRDKAPASDSVGIFIDSDRSKRSAFFFELNAAGVQTDGILFADDSSSTEWDAVWDGNAAQIAGGWSAEFRIPFSALRFSEGREIAFGFGVRRILARTHETLLSVVIPRSALGSVARLGTLVGLNGIKPAHAFELAPYVASRATLRPRATNGDPARPRDLDPVGQVGLDLRSSLGRALSLQATLNPDFGQVDADELVQNLTTFEIFFPEKRPVFTQGMELFQPVTAPGRQSPQQLFYSRRIGLDAPILGAAKVSGNVSNEIQVGLVEAFVAGAGLSGTTESPPRGFAYEPSQPLWFGPKDALPALSPATRNFSSGVVRWRPSAETSVGGTFASAVPFGPRCTGDEAGLSDDFRPNRCDALAGNAAALDFTTRTHDGEWFALGQVTGSQSLGGPPTRVLLDGTTLSRGELGWGAHAAGGRGGGEPWRIEGEWEYESPRLDVNATGFQRTQNEQLGRAVLRYVQIHPGGPFHYYGLAFGALGRWTTDGRGLDRGAQLGLFSEFQLRSFHWFGCNLGFDAVRWDVREIQQSGAAVRRPADVVMDCWTSTDSSRPLSFEAGAGAGHALAAGPLAPVDVGAVFGRVAVRPHPRVETRLDARWEWNQWRARWVATENGSHWLADLTAPVLSLTLRQQVVLTRHLTLQAYAQLFTTYGHYGAFYTAPDGARRVSFSDLTPRPRPSPAEAPDAASPEFHTGALNVNVVLRWEYRTGSTLFLVYTRGQEEADWSGRNPPFSLAPQALASGPTIDTFLVKWSHYWAG